MEAPDGEITVILGHSERKMSYDKLAEFGAILEHEEPNRFIINDFIAERSEVKSADYLRCKIRARPVKLIVRDGDTYRLHFADVSNVISYEQARELYEDFKCTGSPESVDWGNKLSIVWKTISKMEKEN